MAMHQDKPTRVVALQGGVNFRDLGGYLTADQRQVRWHKLFRCGHLQHLTQADVEHLATLRITQVHDLRKQDEQIKSPSRVLLAETVNDYDMAIGSLKFFWDHLWRGALTADVAHELVVDSYRQCIDDVAPHYRRLLLSILNNKENASLFHCAAGKDRTGLAAVLLLHILGVTRATIVEDYLLTQQHFDIDSLMERVESHLKAANVSEWERGWLLPFCSVHEDNIMAFFEAVETRYGSVDHYIVQALGIDPYTQRRMQQAFLE